ncbi:hypothetical protein O181_001354 [Austropuccinia psidii MF-1]|uniref:Uncharacterized protein n=1 Tax=Austropuccinia psidii MF-1 TaxID=1389203 RepID=A0A9Q3BAC6_9BASI|nr:hypothetical protein [Austropuccinia psidii MF-1]
MKYELLQHIEDPENPWETINMDWEMGLVPGNKENDNSFLVNVEILGKSVRCLPFHKEDTEFWTNINYTLGTELAFSKAYQPQTDGPAQRMIKSIQDIIRRPFAPSIEYKELEGYLHNWVTNFPDMQLAYNTLETSTTGKSPFQIEKGCKHFLPVAHSDKNYSTSHLTHN